MTEMKNARIVRVTDPDAAIDEIRRRGRRVVTFSGFSAGGYEDHAALGRLLSVLLDQFEPSSTVVCSGATVAGIGAVYPLAAERGFETIGIVSAMAEKENAGFSDAVDTIFIVADDAWGGYIDESHTLSPTSRVMVEASDEMICIGGGSIARDEYMTAEKLNKSVRFEEADMNHAWAVEKARRKGEPEPRDFRGLLHEYLEQR